MYLNSLTDNFLNEFAKSIKKDYGVKCLQRVIY